MKRFISNSQLILFFGYVIFIAHTGAAPAARPEEVKSVFIARRQRQREARHLARAGPKLPAGTAIGFEKDAAPSVKYSSNWAGAIQSPPPSGKFNSVSAQWTVPTPSPPPSANGSGIWYFSTWVGIDGSSCSSILQAGTSSYVQVTSTGEVTNGANAWYEWYPGNESEFSGFPVSAGDTVQFSVHADNSSRGTVSVNNLSTGNSKSITLRAPTNSSHLCGRGAEWIVEDYDINGKMAPFSNFTTVSFQRCQATTTTGATVRLKNATLVDMAQSGIALATAVYISPTNLEVRYG